jgi:polysaccharide deacetylase family protein (PEP-CTERM system associated)
MVNSITIDLEEYFHPSEVWRAVDCNRWDEMPPRVESATRRVLDLLARHDTKGTFFVLGWVAHRYPRLIRRIAEEGHEIGCHSYAHRLVYDLTRDEFKADTELAVRSIQDACGIRPRCYRAPSYSVTERSLWALDVLAECGFTHDSSIYPISHDRYGILGYSREATVVPTSFGSLLEIPIATIKLRGGHVSPVGGGAYLRLLPYRYTAAGLRRLNSGGHPACLYFHPWELDPQQPRLACGLLSRIRTYTGLKTMEAKIARLLSEFRFAPLTAVFPAPSEYPLSSPASLIESHARSRECEDISAVGTATRLS